MRASRPPGLLAAVAFAALVLPTGPASALEARYLKRLSLPVAEDDIAYGHCVTADSHTGEVFVCDPRTNRILIFDREGYFDFQILGGVEIAAPEDLAVDPDGLIVVLARRGQAQVAIELDFDGTYRRDVPLVGLPVGALAPALGSIALSPEGDTLYLTDGANATLWIADRDGLVLKGVDLASEAAPEERRDFATGHVDTYGDRVVVALPMLGRVLVFSADGEPLGGVGIRGSAAGQLGYSTAAAVDRDGNVIVLDGQRMIVSRWAIAGNRMLSEHLGLGNLPGALYFPFDLSLDPEGRLYVSQSADGRVQVFEGLGAAPAPPAR